MVERASLLCGLIIEISVQFEQHFHLRSRVTSFANTFKKGAARNAPYDLRIGQRPAPLRESVFNSAQGLKVFRAK
jgi:hypothetical protein